MAVVVALLAATLGGLSPSPAAASPVQIQVPGGVATIQGAIDAASDGDVVVVAPGTYHERIDFKGKAIEVRSSAGPASTTIDGDHLSHVVRFRSDETRASVLRGFTITDGVVHETIVGGGVAIEDASPTIVGNVVTGNDGLNHLGAGVGAFGGSPRIVDNQISGNFTGPGGGGGGVFAFGNAEIVGNLIEGNSAGGGGGAFVSGDVRFTGNVVRGNHAGVWDGGGVTIEDGHPVVAQNLIVGNSAELRGGGVFLPPAAAGNQRVVLGNTIADNQAPRGSAILGDFVGVTVVNNLVVGGGSSTVLCDAGVVAPGSFHHNLVSGGQVRFDTCPDQTGINGNLSADPLFAGPGDYRLRSGSPAIDAGDPAAVALPTGLDGLARVTDGNGDGSAVIDLGAYEGPTFVAHPPQMPYSVWSQPSATPLDGLGGWVFPLDDPVAGIGQLVPSYLYAQYFGFVAGGAVGQVGLLTGAGGKFAVFSVVEADGTAHNLSVPLEWAPQHFYLPFVSHLGAGSWGAWVYDDAAATWTSIGTLSLPAAWGKLAPASVTAVPWLGPVAGDCARYPRADVLFYAPFGFVGTTGSVGTLTVHGTGVGDCPPATSTVGPWTRYQLGV